MKRIKVFYWAMYFNRDSSCTHKNKLTIEKVRNNKSLLLRTSNYAGSIVAAHIDELNIPEIVSTLAGINNIMIICQSDSDADIVLQAFKAISE